MGGGIRQIGKSDGNQKLSCSKLISCPVFFEAKKNYRGATSTQHSVYHIYIASSVILNFWQMYSQ